MVAVLLSLLASSCWGIADFTAGLRARRVALPVVLAFVEGTGLVLVLILIAVEAEPLPSARAIALSMVAGTAGVLALGAFYRALAIGTMSIVAPISATGVALPVLVGVATGDRLSVVTSAGLAVAVVGVVLASREADEGAGARGGRTSVGLALAAAVGFGSYFVLSDAAADESVLWLLALARIVILPVLLVAIVVRREAIPRRPDALALMLAGTLDVTATGLYGVANTKGALSIVSVVGSLYPVATVLLARVVLGERIRSVQTAGIVAALGGIALIAAG